MGKVNVVYLNPFDDPRLHMPMCPRCLCCELTQDMICPSDYRHCEGPSEEEVRELFNQWPTEEKSDG